MKTKKLFSRMIAGLFLLFSAAAGRADFSDNFNDNIKSPAWGADTPLEGTNAVLQETNGRLEFTGSSSGIIRPFVAQLGSYTQSWESAVDVNIGSLTLPQDGTWMQMFLAVADLNDMTNHHLTVAMDIYREGGISRRGYEMTAASSGKEFTNAPNYGYAATSDLQGRVRIAFNASTKILTAFYNGTQIGSLDIDQAGTSWGLGNSSPLVVAVGGSMGGDSFTNTGHEVYADNFEFRTGNNLTYALTVNNGSGSGSYTNGASVTVIASNAPAGQVFDRWAGATQYISNVTSSTAAVTMPALAVSLTATYKLTGAASGDDFADNSRNPAKWGDDIYFDTNSAAVLLETNGCLEVRKEAGPDSQGVLRPWIESVGSYTQSWEAAADVFLGDVSLVQDGAWININLAVANRNDTNLVHGVPMGDFLGVALDLYRENGLIHRGYELTSMANGTELTNTPNYAYVPAADQKGRLRILFDASTKVLTAFYNGKVLGQLDIDAPVSNWGMTAADTFGIVIAGAPGTESLEISAGQVYADNFSVIGTVAPPADGDGNGLPDWWEQQYFGGTGINPQTVCSNGVNKVYEAYVAGFDPNDPEAWFGITGGDLRTKTIQWNAVSGRVYSVYWTTNLLNGFQPLETNYTGGVFTDSLHSAASKCFYKLQVRLKE